jgi:hypothetical protein
MARQLGDLVHAYNLPAVRSWTYLVVTDQALPANPALADALRRIRPDRHPRFVCSIDELELLLDAGARGWSVPGMVRTWQAGALEQTLAAHLHRAIISVTPLTIVTPNRSPTGSPGSPPTTRKSPETGEGSVRG